MGSVRFQRAVYAVVAILAALTGVILVAAPGSTERLFAWALGPPAVAALTGGLFIGAGIVYAFASGRAGVAGRGFALLSIVFAGPVFGYTLLHRDLFDFGRWQALVWLVGFGLIILLAILMLSTGAWSSAGRGPMAATWARAILALLGLAGVAVATAMWVKSEGPRPWAPLELSQFAGQLFGMWFAVIGFACLWSAIRPAEEARVFVVGVTALLAGAAVGAIRGFGGLVPADRGFFLGGLAAAFVLLLLVLAFQRAGARAAEG
jgi:hypothetical protein